MTTTLVFSHGNSFPAGTYRLLLEQLRTRGFDVCAVDRFGHDPRYPVSNNWPTLRHSRCSAQVRRCTWWGTRWAVF